MSTEHFEELVTVLKPKTLNFCGNLGDPIFHKKLDKFVKFGAEQGCDFYMSTAGVGKNLKWWESFYNSYTKGKIYFGLDGLEDTAHKYRVGTDWHNVFDARSWVQVWVKMLYGSGYLLVLTNTKFKKQNN